MAVNQHFTNDDMINTIMEYIKHIPLNAYCMGQKNLHQNSKHWGAYGQNSAWKCQREVQCGHEHSWPACHFQALFCTCAAKCLEFCCKLFWPIQWAFNGMCLMYSMMVLIMSSLVKCWFTGKYLVLHYFAYIRGITERIDINSFQQYYRHIMGCISCILLW